MADSEGALRTLKSELTKLAESLDDMIPRSPSAYRAEIRRLGEILDRIESFAKAKLSAEQFGTSGESRILGYLQMFIGEAVDRRELQAAAAIDDWSRRVRTLRVEQGYKISSGMDRDDIEVDQYVLEDSEPDLKKGAAWQVANKIRRMKGSGEKRMLALLSHYIGKPVKSEALYYVAQIKDYQRRLRQLRTESGYAVATKNTGRLDLKPDEYVLETRDQLPPHDRKIDVEVYEGVLKRDKSACVKCGWTIEQRHPSSKKQRLQVHHKLLHSKGGSNTAENLITLCNVHHEDIHRNDIDETRIDAWLRAGSRH